MSARVTKIPIAEWREDAPAILKIRICRNNQFWRQCRDHALQLLSLLYRRPAGGTNSPSRPCRNSRLFIEPAKIK